MTKSKLSFLVLGLQRTGTNLAGYYINSMAPHHQNINFNKHADPSQPFVEELRRKENTSVVLVVRHPVLWVESILHNSPHDFYLMHKDKLPNIEEKAEQLSEFYSRYYEAWMEQSAKGIDISLFRYEDILRDDGAGFGAWLRKKSGARAALPSSPVKLRESAPFSMEDRQKALEFRTSLPQPAIDAIMARQSFLIETAQYSEEQLTVSPLASTRTLLYEFVRRGEQAIAADPQTAARAAVEHPASPLAHLAAHMAIRGRAGHHEDHLASLKSSAVSAFQNASMSGAEIQAVINLTLAAGRPEEASFLLTVYENANLDVGQLLSLKVKIAEAKNQQQDVERILRAGLELAPQATDLGIKLAHLLLNRGEGEEALQVLDRLAAACGPDSWIVGTRGLVMWRIGRLEEAERNVRESLAILRNSGTLQATAEGGNTIVLAGILVGAGKFAEARELLGGLKDYPRSDWFEEQLNRARGAIAEHDRISPQGPAANHAPPAAEAKADTSEDLPSQIRLRSLS